jgi:translation elongation factor EF-4
LQLRLCPLAQWRTIDRIEIVKNGTVRVEKDVDVLVTAPSHFPTNPKILLIKKEVAAESGISTSANALGRVIRAVQRIRGRLSRDGTDPKSQVKLLSQRCAPAEQKQREGRA